MQTELTQEQAIAVLTEITDCLAMPISDHARLLKVKRLLSRFVLCEKEPIGYLYQHEDTGMTASVSAQAHDCGFERLNPRYTLIGPLHKPADIGKEGA